MKRIRILHTADLHLDASFASLGVNASLGNKLRAAQRSVFSRIMERARDWPADLVVISGDLFDSTEVQSETVKFAAEALEHLAPVPVYIAPGHSDPYTEDSPYATALWPKNVTLFTPGNWQQHSHPLQDICIHGIGCDGSDDSGSWFTTLQIPADNRIHIALACGTEQSQQDNGFALFDGAAIAQKGLAYLALGHLHNAVEVKNDFSTVIHYPGTPQGRNFREQGERSFLEVNIEEAASGALSVFATPVPCNRITFKQYTCTIGTDKNPENDLDKIIEGDATQQVARVQVAGVLTPPAYGYIEALRNYAKKRFFHAEILDGTDRTANPPVLAGQRTCLSKLSEVMANRIADASDHDTVLFEAYARDLALVASRSHTLPNHDAEDPLS